MTKNVRVWGGWDKSSISLSLIKLEFDQNRMCAQNMHPLYMGLPDHEKI